MKTTVAILGSARPEGQALAHSLANAGFPLRLMCSQHDDLIALAAELNKTYPDADIDYSFADRETTWEADVIIPAAPFVLFNTITEKIKDVITGKVLIVIPDALFTQQTCEKTNQLAVEDSLHKTLPYTKLVNAQSPEKGLSTIKDKEMADDVRRIIGNMDLAAVSGV